MNNKIISVVTGGSGFVGSHLVDLLISEGHQVRCIVRESSSLKWLEGKQVEIYKCGLFDKVELKEVMKDADYLFHVAGVVKAKKEEGYYKGNVETTRNLLDTILEVNNSIKRVLIVSSQTAAGPSPRMDAITEAHTPTPITTYGRSKLAQEQLAKSYMNKMPITIVRPSAVYGERDTEIYLIFKTYKQGLMTLVGFNDKRVSLIHVADLAKGIYKAAISEKGIGQTYFISSKEYYSWPQVSKVISKVMGKKALQLRIPHPIVYTVAAIAQFFAIFSSKAATFNLEKARDFVQTYWTCDISKAENELGYRQEVSLEEGLKRTIDWYREMKWL